MLNKLILAALLLSTNQANAGSCGFNKEKDRDSCIYTCLCDSYDRCKWVISE